MVTFKNINISPVNWEQTLKESLVNLSCFSEGKRGEEKYSERIVDFAFDFINEIESHSIDIQFRIQIVTPILRGKYMCTHSCMHVLHC